MSRRHVCFCAVLACFCAAFAWCVAPISVLHAQTPPPYDDLLGAYAVLDDGQCQVLTRIEKHDGAYWTREWNEESKTWSEQASQLELADEALREASRSGRQELSQGFGFTHGDAFLLRVPMGWQFENTISITGYTLMTLYGGLDLFKIDPDTALQPTCAYTDEQNQYVQDID